MTETFQSSEPALFRWFPDLKDRFPWVGLTQTPSPTHRLANLGKVLGMSELYIKRDDQCGLWYGGNKPRKLEFLLGDALARSSGAVITFGGLGSNHALATAICAGKLELVPVLILVPQPVSESVRRNLLLMGSQGAELVYARGKTSATLAAVRLTLKHLVAGGGRPPYLILPGGSSPVGCLGYVSSALRTGGAGQGRRAASARRYIRARGVQRHDGWSPGRLEPGRNGYPRRRSACQ